MNQYDLHLALAHIANNSPIMYVWMVMAIMPALLAWLCVLTSDNRALPYLPMEEQDEDLVTTQIMEPVLVLARAPEKPIVVDLKAEDQKLLMRIQQMEFLARRFATSAMRKRNEGDQTESIRLLNLSGRYYHKAHLMRLNGWDLPSAA